MRQALEALRKLKTEKTAESKNMRLKLDNLKTHKAGAHPARSWHEPQQALTVAPKPRSDHKALHRFETRFCMLHAAKVREHLQKRSAVWTMQRSIAGNN